MRKDYLFVYRALTHKKNTRFHYPACKQLLRLFLKKWELKKDSTYYGIYSKSLSRALRISIL